MYSPNNNTEALLSAGEKGITTQHWFSPTLLSSSPQQSSNSRNKGSFQDGQPSGRHKTIFWGVKGFFALSSWRMRFNLPQNVFFNGRAF